MELNHNLIKKKASLQRWEWRSWRWTRSRWSHRWDFYLVLGLLIYSSLPSIANPYLSFKKCLLFVLLWTQGRQQCCVLRRVNSIWEVVGCWNSTVLKWHYKQNSLLGSVQTQKLHTGSCNHIWLEEALLSVVLLPFRWGTWSAGSPSPRLPAALLGLVSGFWIGSSEFSVVFCFVWGLQDSEPEMPLLFSMHLRRGLPIGDGLAACWRCLHIWMHAAPQAATGFIQSLKPRLCYHQQ